MGCPFGRSWDRYETGWDAHLIADLTVVRLCAIVPVPLRRISVKGLDGKGMHDAAVQRLQAIEAACQRDDGGHKEAVDRLFLCAIDQVGKEGILPPCG